MGPETMANKQGIKCYQTIIGDGNWLVQTTHPTLAAATSVLAGYTKAPLEAAYIWDLIALSAIPEEGSSIQACERAHEQGRLCGGIQQ